MIGEFIRKMATEKGYIGEFFKLIGTYGKAITYSIFAKWYLLVISAAAYAAYSFFTILGNTSIEGSNGLNILDHSYNYVSHKLERAKDSVDRCTCLIGSFPIYIRCMSNPSGYSKCNRGNEAVPQK